MVRVRIVLIFLQILIIFRIFRIKSISLLRLFLKKQIFIFDRIILILVY